MTVVVNSIVASPDTGLEGLGDTITITIGMSDTVTVAGVTPTLLLNDGGTAIYDAAKSTATSLVFDYEVIGGQFTKNLGVIGVSDEGGILDASGNNVDFTGTAKIFPGLQIDSSSFTYAYQSTLSATNTLYIQTYDANEKPIALGTVV